MLGCSLTTHLCYLSQVLTHSDLMCHPINFRVRAEHCNNNVVKMGVWVTKLITNLTSTKQEVEEVVEFSRQTKCWKSHMHTSSSVLFWAQCSITSCAHGGLRWKWITSPCHGCLYLKVNFEATDCHTSVTVTLYY